MLARVPLRSGERRFTGWHMLAVVILFFGTIIAVNIVMILAATGTFPGLVVANSYVASQHYNEALESDRAQARAGWRMDLDAPGGIVTFRLADRDGIVQHRLTTIVRAGRPSSTREDREIELRETEAGYSAAAPLPAGLWEIDVEARRDGAPVFRARKRLYVAPGG
jgi:nitrogen fixation protein FixH